MRQTYHFLSQCTLCWGLSHTLLWWYLPWRSLSTLMRNKRILGHSNKLNLRIIKSIDQSIINQLICQSINQSITISLFMQPIVSLITQSGKQKIQNNRNSENWKYFYCWRFDYLAVIVSTTLQIPDDNCKAVETSIVKMFSLFGVSVVLYFFKIPRGYRNFWANLLTTDTSLHSTPGK